MYESFYGLSEKPFALTPNPKFVFQSEQYRTAEQSLRYGIAQKEAPFPDGYALLPKKRIQNVQFKGKTLLEPKQKLDWGGILTALVKDGYKGYAGLETHYLDGTDPEKAHLCVKEIRRILES